MHNTRTGTLRWMHTCVEVQQCRYQWKQAEMIKFSVHPLCCRARLITPNYGNCISRPPQPPLGIHHWESTHITVPVGKDLNVIQQIANYQMSQIHQKTDTYCPLHSTCAERYSDKKCVCVQTTGDIQHLTQHTISIVFLQEFLELEVSWGEPENGDLINGLCSSSSQDAIGNGGLLLDGQESR